MRSNVKKQKFFSDHSEAGIASPTISITAVQSRERASQQSTPLLLEK